MSFFKKIFGGKAQKQARTKIPRPRTSENPAVQSCDLDHYIADRVLQEKSLDIHSAFQLKFEAVRIGRNAYRQPAWGNNLYTRQLYELFMLCLTARALGCSDQAAIAERWFLEDKGLLKEDLSHHFADKVKAGQDVLHDKDFLHSLAKLRSQKDALDHDLGPFHLNVFPYAYAPELELLSPGSCPEFDRTVPLDSEVEAIIVELQTGSWD